MAAAQATARMPQVGSQGRASLPALSMASAAALAPGACRLSPGTGGWAHAAAAGAALVAAATKVLLAPSLPLLAVSWLVPGGNTAAGGGAWPHPHSHRGCAAAAAALSVATTVWGVSTFAACAGRHAVLPGTVRMWWAARGAANVVLVDWSSTLPLTGVARAAAVATDAATGAVGGGRRSRLRHPRRGGSRRRRRRGG